MSPLNYHALIREVPDFPKPGILFYDITTLLKDARALSAIADELTVHYQGHRIAKVIGIESRGFIFGGILADRLNAGFVLRSSTALSMDRTPLPSTAMQLGRENEY